MGFSQCFLLLFYLFIQAINLIYILPQGSFFEPFLHCQVLPICKPNPFIN